MSMNSTLPDVRDDAASATPPNSKPLLLILIPGEAIDSLPSYQKEWQREAFENSVRQIRDCLSKYMTIESCKTNPGQELNYIATSINALLAEHPQATDIILYYAGHGDTSLDAFTIVTRTSKHRPNTDTIELKQLQKQINHKFRGRLYMILDACYSGAAFNSLLPWRVPDIPESLDAGVAVLAITPEDSQVLFENSAAPSTRFSQSFVNVISQHAAKDAPRALTLSDLETLINTDSGLSVKAYDHEGKGITKYPVFSFRQERTTKVPQLSESAKTNVTPESNQKTSRRLSFSVRPFTRSAGFRSRRFTLIPSLMILLPFLLIVTIVANVAWFRSGAPIDQKPLAPETLEVTHESPMPAPPIKGRLDFRITEIGNARRDRLMLHQTYALPLRPKDVTEIDITLDSDAFVYLVYLNAVGVATPLFPWLKGDWNQRPPEAKRGTLYKTGPVTPGPSGIETLLLLVRPDRLPDDLLIQNLFTGLPTKTPAHNPNARAWFENGQLVRSDPLRGPIQFDDDGDPLVQTHAALHQKLRLYFPYTQAVCFAFRNE